MIFLKITSSSVKHLVFWDPPSEISAEELEQAMGEEKIPDVVEATAGTIQRAQRHCQSPPEFRDSIQPIVEDVVMKKAIPVMVEAIRSQFDQAFSAFIPVLVQELWTKLGHNPSSRSFSLHAESSETRSLALRFASQVPGDGVLYTFTNIQEHEGAPLIVELCDSSGSRVESGRESFAKIKLYVLQGDFNVEDRDDWTAHDFDNNVAKPRENKGPLLKGKCEICMSHGAVTFSDIAFTDNSKPSISGKFRFGARVVKGLPPGVVVKDAVGEAFKVKERRGKFYCKHRTPSLDDRTDCLKHIGKTLCQKLADRHQVHTVKDFLQLCNTDADALQKILQISGNKWSELVNFAKSCLLTDKGYLYDDKESCSVLLLDCVFNIVGIKFNNQACHPYGNLNDSQKKLVNKMRCTAYEMRHELPPFDISSDLKLLQAEFPTVDVLHPSKRHQGATTADIMKILSEHPNIGRKQGGEDGCSLTTNQTYQGEQELLCSPLDTAEQGMLFVTSEQARLPAYQAQALCCQQKFSAPPNASFFEGAEAFVPDLFRTDAMNYSEAMVPNIDAPDPNCICQSTGEFNICKRARLG